MSEVRQAIPLSAPESAALRYLPEGPYPLEPGRFSWVAIQHGGDAKHGSLNIFDLTDERNESFDLPGRPGFAFPCQSPGKFVVGCERELGYFETVGGSWEPICTGIDSGVENTIINDGLVIEDNLIFGTKDLEFATKKAGLYLWRGRDQRLIQLRDDQICSNGKAILRDTHGDLRFLDIDSPTRTVVSYPIDIASGRLGSAESVIDLTADPAVPDGAILTPDSSGIIISMFRGDAVPYGETRLYELESGELLCTWQTPGSPQNTCPTLVQTDNGLKLIITTAVEHMSPSDQQKCPHAGRIFTADVDFAVPAGPLAPVFPA